MRFWFIALALLATACTDPDGARRALADAGYTDVRIGGYDVWGCDDKDTFATAFEATGPTGRPVKGVVCNGFWKGYTIRLH